MEGGGRERKDTVHAQYLFSRTRACRADLARSAQRARLHRLQRAGLRQRRTRRATPVCARATRRGRGTQPGPAWLRPARCRQWRLICVFVHRSTRNPQLGSSSLLASIALVSQSQRLAFGPRSRPASSACRSAARCLSWASSSPIPGAEHQARGRGRWPHSRATQSSDARRDRKLQSASLPHQRTARSQRSRCGHRARPCSALTPRQAPTPPGEVKRTVPPRSAADRRGAPQQRQGVEGPDAGGGRGGAPAAPSTSRAYSSPASEAGADASSSCHVTPKAPRLPRYPAGGAPSNPRERGSDPAPADCVGPSTTSRRACRAGARRSTTTSPSRAQPEGRARLRGRSAARSRRSRRAPTGAYASLRRTARGQGQRRERDSNPR